MNLAVFCSKYLEIENENEFINHLESITNNEDILFLGGGSNILFTKDFEGLVVKNNIKGKDTIRETDEWVELKVGSGEVWHDLVMYCVRRNWGGLENLSLIPGTVGAAPIQNIGAYGVEVKDVLTQVEAIEMETGKKLLFDNKACDFGYRDSVFKRELKGKVFITSITLRLTKTNHNTNINYGAIQKVIQLDYNNVISIENISNAVISIRQSKLPDPRQIGNCGSFFKNPIISASLFESLKNDFPTLPSYPVIGNSSIKIPAGWLIEQCGWKGKTIDKRYGVHQQQALVLVNYGKSTGSEIKTLAMDIQKSVFDKFKVEIIPEVNII